MNKRMTETETEPVRAYSSFSARFVYMKTHISFNVHKKFYRFDMKQYAYKWISLTYTQSHTVATATVTVNQPTVNNTNCYKLKIHTHIRAIQYKHRTAQHAYTANSHG